MVLSIRARVLAGIALPALAIVAVFSVVVFARVRTDRTADLDAALRARAAALAALVERDDEGRWESEPLEPIAGSDVAFEVRAFDARSPNGGPLIGASEGAVGSLPVRDVEGLQIAWPDARTPRPLLVDGRVGDAPGLRTFIGVFLVRAEEPARASTAGDDNDDNDDRDDERRPAGVGGTSEAPLVRVVVASSTAPLEADLRALARTLATAGALLALLALVAGWLLSGRIVAPLARMARAAEAVREPTRDPPLDVPPHGGDEVARLGRSLNDAFARTYEAYERQRRFAADASHELRTPIAVVRTEAEVMLRAQRTVDQYRASLATILDGAARMQRTVEGLLLLARVDRGALEAALAPVDVAEIARDVVTQHVGARVPVALHARDAAVVRGNGEHLRVLVSNLVDNAVRHARTRVDIEIDVARDGTLELRVRDDGDGIPADARERVFERFFRVDAARASDAGGAGLGLSIVRTIAQLHGGTAVVGARARGTDGAVLVVTLPRA